MKKRQAKKIIIRSFQVKEPCRWGTYLKAITKLPSYNNACRFIFTLNNHKRFGLQKDFRGPYLV